MSDIQLVDHSTVQLIKTNASDGDVAAAAWVSNYAEAALEKDTARIEGLINFLYREQHTSPFEHGSFTFFVDTPIFVAREYLRHRTSCLDGDTEIAFANGKSKTIAKHWEHWHLGVEDSLGRRRILPSVKSSKVWSIDENTLDHAKSTVLDVVKGEPKEMFQVETSRGFKIVASADHKFFDGSEWLTVKEMVPHSTNLMVRHKTLSSKSNHKIATPQGLRSAINHWSNMQFDNLRERDGDLCACGSPASVVDHVIPVAENLKMSLDIDNLQLLCKSCDRTKTSIEQKLADRVMKFTMVGPDTVVRVSSVGIRDSYDLVLDGPHHNFLGDGIVTHNSYNETSGRYKVLSPRFYLPPTDRPLVQTGKVGSYVHEAGTDEMYAIMATAQRHSFEVSWNAYQRQLEAGIAKEVARNVLPLAIMTQFYVTVNPLNLLKFFTLRTEENALHEIRAVSKIEETMFKEAMPLTYAAFEKKRQQSRKFKELLELADLDELLERLKNEN